MTFQLFFKNQNYIIYMMAVMIISGIMKDKNIFSGLYNMLINRFKSKRILLTIISAVSGVIPVPGRVVISAGILDTIQSDKKHRNNWKLGILDYLSTHHYYLWSPLEKSIIILMGALGLSYLQVLSYTFPLLVISLSILLFYIFVMIKEEDIDVVAVDTKVKNNNFFTYMIPVITSIGLICKYDPWIVMPILMMYFILISRTFNIKKLIGYINFKLVALLINVIIVGNIAKHYTTELTAIVEHFSNYYSLETYTGMLIISCISFFISFLMGSSSRYTGIVALLASVYGLQYLTYFIAVEFSAYLLSPTHKCVAIGKMYFATPMWKYYKVIIIWTTSMITYSLIF